MDKDPMIPVIIALYIGIPLLLAHLWDRADKREKKRQQYRERARERYRKKTGWESLDALNAKLRTAYREVKYYE
jgi:hypothetical protein